MTPNSEKPEAEGTQIIDVFAAIQAAEAREAADLLATTTGMNARCSDCGYEWLQATPGAHGCPACRQRRAPAVPEAQAVPDVEGLIERLNVAERRYQNTGNVKHASGLHGEAAAALASLRAESEGRLRVLNEKADEARREWMRAEAAEARAEEAERKVGLADELRARVAALSAPLAVDEERAKEYERHDCDRWRMEGVGCAECNPIADKIAHAMERAEAAEARAEEADQAARQSAAIAANEAHEHGEALAEIDRLRDALRKLVEAQPCDRDANFTDEYLAAAEAARVLLNPDLVKEDE